MTCLILCWELFKISLFVVGGGYAIIVVADEVFSRLGWTEENELIDRLGVFQMIPGLIATHVAVYVGRKRAGLKGAALGVAAVALPSVAIFTAVSAGYDRLPLDHPLMQAAFAGLRAALVGVIGATLVKSAAKTLRGVFAAAVALLGVAALATGVLGVPSVLALAMAAGLVAEVAGRRRDAPGGRTLVSSPLALLVFLKYGALCFGGGFVLVPMYVEDFVGPLAPYLQITGEEFSNLMALTQMTPGPIGVNGATYFGYRIWGLPGAVLASACLLLPGSLLAYAAFSSLERFRTSLVVAGILRGVRPAAVALMAVALWTFLRLAVFAGGRVDFLSAALALGAFALVFARRLSVMRVILLSALLSLLRLL